MISSVKSPGAGHAPGVSGGGRSAGGAGGPAGFGGGSEALWQATVAYRQFAVVEYNAHPVVPGRGSEIFLHDDVGGPTNGCVSLPAPQLVTLLRWLRPPERPLIVIGTVAEIRHF